ncbi:eukaryotic translation initiation factor 3 subunit A isoform X2 [Brachionus plicatilis]|uniref:Eukaryotic translation initiation factor 3 subunit A n=1 Tax=Brachionus plicatilis TaxID=10195 RepID=A0A3M7RRN9_BRAPC|nr:eukaryotic translation initiation factor 3 subunit A isoform X2 [Brachionus plicatilis]
MPFAKPENALQRAEEFINVGKKQRALDTLYEIIRSKKHRTWQKIHEEIMKNYLELCVDLKESHMAKDGLHQYKNICLNVNVKSLEETISGFLHLAEEKAEKAKKDASDANVLADVDDLEYINSPESVLLKAVSGESSQDRTDRDLLAPWLKFVWESYKQCLELLKNNNKLENLYQSVAKQAFLFCVKYQRKTEFRKLCETIRQHMVQSQKYVNAQQIDLNKQETQNNHLEIRFLQLNHAISMELWQEAYKAVEDIYGLMSMSRSKPKPGQMYNYYSKLSLIFWKAGNHLFHAVTLQKLFVLLKEQKKTITQEELTKISSKLLLATLAIPIPPNRSIIDECLDQDEVTLEKLKRLSSLLNLQQSPTRLSLLKDLQKYNVINHVFPEIKDLYKSLECEFNPLKLSERVNKCLDYLESRTDLANENYNQYIQPIREIAVTRLLKQISQIYTTIEIKRFLRLIPKGVDDHTLEKLIVDSAKNLDLQVRINHQTKSLHFGNDLYVSQKDDMPEGPSIQSMPSEQIRNQLINMSQALQQANQIISRDESKKRHEELSVNIANVYRQTCDKHHVDLLRRKHLIEKQKEMYEYLAGEKERQEMEKKRQKLAELEERAKVGADFRPKKDMYEAIEAEIDQRNKDEDKALQQEIEEANKAKREMTEKLKKEEKKLDHFVRACHENEISLIQKGAEKEQEDLRKFWDEQEKERIEHLKKEALIQKENRERLMRMGDDKDAFFNLILAGRKSEFEQQMKEFTDKLRVSRESKLLERKEKRKTERRDKYLKEIEEEKKREEMEKKKRDEEEIRRKADEQARKQRQREREIEEKLAKEQVETKKEEKPAPAPYRPRALGGAGISRPEKPQTSSEELGWRRKTEEPAAWNRSGPEPDRRGFRDSKPPAPAPTRGAWKEVGSKRREEKRDDDVWRRPPQ